MIDEKTQTPVVMKSLVDTFTTAKIGLPLVTFPMSIGETVRFSDSPYRYFIDTLKRTIHAEMADAPITKDEYRDAILRSLRKTRDTGRDPRHPHVLDWRCRFRCHQLDKKIIDMYLFLDGSPVDERILDFDLVTGHVEDTEDSFGLQEKTAAEITTTPSGLKPREKTLEIMQGLRNYEAEIEELEEMVKNPPPGMFRILKKEIKTKRAELEMHNLRLLGLNKRAKLKYNEVLQKKHGGEPIKLSVILKTAIDNGTIDPEIDFVVVFACRVPSMKVERELHSPRDLDEPRSVGGFSRSKKNKLRGLSKTRKNKY